MGGSHRVIIESGDILPDGDWAWEVSDLAESWPYLGITWLRATEKALPESRPWHTVGHRGRGELAYLPGFIFDADPAVDFDPRTYLGWQSSSGQQVCCGVSGNSNTSCQVEALGHDALFPTLVISSPLGYRSEAAFTFWNRNLFPALVEHAVRSAFAHGVKSVIAPWIPDRKGNEHLVAGFHAIGGSSTFWGYEDFLRLDAQDYDTHVAALPRKRRIRVKEDLARVDAAGITLDRIVGEEIRPLISRIAELTCLNRAKNGAGQEPTQIEVMLHALLDAGLDVRCHRGRKNGATVGVCVTIRKTDRLFLKWAGFDYAALGDRSGLYFALIFDAPLRDAYAEGFQVLEFGAGAHEAKALRGCTPRLMTTALVVADESSRTTTAAWLADFGRRRQEVFSVKNENTAPPTAESTETNSFGCCDQGRQLEAEERRVAVITIESAAFKPSYPRPTHRIDVATVAH